MRYSRLFGKTQREIPSDAETISHQMLLRSGMIAQLTAGVYSFMPLAWRSIQKIENIIRQEMNKSGCQELAMPVLQPVEIWQQSGREAPFGQTLFHLKDRKDRNLVLGPTHEEVITDLASRYIQSYRDLPQRLYQIQTKFRDEPRPRGGLIRVREFIMKDMYSFDASPKGLDESYQTMKQAYENVYRRCGLESMVIDADSGAIGGKASHEFMIVAESGEDSIIYCPKCNYAANAEKAVFKKKTLPKEPPKDLEEVATPGQKTISEVAAFLSLKPENTLKAVFYMADGKFVMAVIRGDLDINEIKLKNLLKCNDLRLAEDSEVKAAGIAAGFASPVGLKNSLIVADDSVENGSNFVAGANKDGFHLKNVNFGRDFKADKMADIALAAEGAACPFCDGTFASKRGVEVGHIFKLGTFLSERFGANFTDAEGISHPIIMGCYGMGVGRLLAAAIEQNHDEKGIIWPMPIAPYQVHICGLFLDNPAVSQAAEKIYTELEAQGVEVLFDDRELTAGVKFNDADLLGIPLRLTISPRNLDKGGVELKLRRNKESELVPLESIVERVITCIKSQSDL
ncbi:proline--tRNA ligase [Dehalococcoides mccartyi]|uniref:Proline--tRNA ligase n=1 Tax=Dehalococcoides mccartyi TaxID=61435 RepID=A0A0V8M4T6_9CHLR|nr:proline--tRNA ligase [Dehalococcoides mccartyi]KSV18812.1 proline--tRNA ligase [Dehalococcoides mccartyi]